MREKKESKGPNHFSRHEFTAMDQEFKVSSFIKQDFSSFTEHDTKSQREIFICVMSRIF